MSISRANYISPLVFTHYHKSENTSLGLVTQLKTTADLWNSLACHYGASWLALTSVWTTPIQIALVKRPTGLKRLHNEPTYSFMANHWEMAAKMDAGLRLCQPLWLTLISIKSEQMYGHVTSRVQQKEEKSTSRFDSFLSEQHLWQITEQHDKPLF